MRKLETRKISVNYDVPIEKFGNVEIGIPEMQVASSVYLPYKGKTVTDYKKVTLGPFKIQLRSGINSNNFTSPRTGVHKFKAALFVKPHGEWNYGPGKELLEGFEMEGFEPADPWQIVEYMKTYPANHINKIAGGAGKPFAFDYDTKCNNWGRSILTGLSLKPLDFPKDLEYLVLALGIQKGE